VTQGVTPCVSEGGSLAGFDACACHVRLKPKGTLDNGQYLRRKRTKNLAWKMKFIPNS
jgi:hypothetical protein